MTALGAAGLAWLAVCSLPSAGCYTHQCDPQNVPYAGGSLTNGPNGFGYYTNPLASTATPWVDFAGSATIIVTYPPGIKNALVGCQPGLPTAWIGTWTDPPDQPNDDGGNFTTGSGNLAEFDDVSNAGFRVTNGTCQEYGLTVFVPYACPGDAGAPDAPDASE